uniref:ABC transporter substrate-binding protein n=1 Tax=Anaerolinea sp. TaxID=1872519 RepID=UPI002ACDC3E4
DADWANVPQVLKDGVTYGDKVLGLPAAQFIMGYFVNKDLFEAANLDAPEYAVSPEDFFASVTALNNPAKGVLGLDEMEFVLGWYPHTVDPNLKWFSFDGTKMNYNSAAFKQGIAKVAELKPYTWQGLTDEQKANFKSQGPWELFLNQEVGVRWEGGWNLPNFVQNATFEWDFVGIPGGTQALVMDIMAVSKTTKNLEEAYKFAKWMTFSSEAYAKEAELAKAAGSAPKMPVAMDDASLALYREFVDKPGVNAALDNLDASLVESLAKIVPGYIQARWEGKPGIDIGEDKDVNMWYMFNFASEGKFKYEDYAAKLEEFANKILADAKAEVEASLK